MDQLTERAADEVAAGKLKAKLAREGKADARLDAVVAEAMLEEAMKTAADVLGRAEVEVERAEEWVDEYKQRAMQAEAEKSHAVAKRQAEHQVEAVWRRGRKRVASCPPAIDPPRARGAQVCVKSLFDSCVSCKTRPSQHQSGSKRRGGCGRVAKTFTRWRCEHLLLGLGCRTPHRPGGPRPWTSLTSSSICYDHRPPQHLLCPAKAKEVLVSQLHGLVRGCVLGTD